MKGCEINIILWLKSPHCRQCNLSYHSLFWLCTGSSIKGYEINLILWPKSPHYRPRAPAENVSLGFGFVSSAWLTCRWRQHMSIMII